MVELDSLNTKYKDCMKDVERLKMDLRYAVNFLLVELGIVSLFDF
jgi:hypothetical protein